MDKSALNIILEFILIHTAAGYELSAVAKFWIAALPEILGVVAGQQYCLGLFTGRSAYGAGTQTSSICQNEFKFIRTVCDE